ncbi:hypothetical protein GIB67_018614, partial [Kingdonia uniflora]
MYHGWVSSRGGEGLKVRPIEITGKVSNILVLMSCSEDEFVRTLEGKAFVRMVTIAFVIGAIGLPRSDFNWERDAPYGVCLNVLSQSPVRRERSWVMEWDANAVTEGEIGDVDGCRVENNRLLDSVYFRHLLGDSVRFPTPGGGFLVPGRVETDGALLLEQFPEIVKRLERRLCQWSCLPELSWHGGKGPLKRSGKWWEREEGNKDE